MLVCVHIKILFKPLILTEDVFLSGDYNKLLRLNKINNAVWDIIHN